MILICCGMRRSASTLQYHITQEIVMLNGGTNAGWLTKGAESFDKLSHASEDLTVCKVHLYLPNVSPLARQLFASKQAGAIYIFRDPMDVAASLKRFRPTLFGKRTLKAVANEHRTWVSHPGVLVSRYDDVINNIEGEAIRIAYRFGLELTTNQAMDIGKKLAISKQRARMPESGYDDKINFWYDHISTGENGLWRTELTTAEKGLVEQIMGDIIRQYRAWAGGESW